MNDLRRELAARGYFRRKPFRATGELGIFVAATLIGIGLLVSVDSFLVDILAMTLVAWSALGVSTNAHTASHGAISNNTWVNQALAYFGYPFFLQVSLSYWRHKHIVVHHPHPNVIGRDDDADLSPYFAINEDEVRSASWFRRRACAYQWILLPVLMFGNSFVVVARGWCYLIRQLRNKATRQWRHWLDLTALSLHVAAWLLLPMAYFAPSDVIVFNIVRFGLVAYGMFALFAPAHFPEEAVFLARKAGTADIVLLQTATTVNFRTGFLGRLLCGGVEYQIEHHLFPSVPPVHYPEVSKIVRAYCETHGYPYRTLGWWEAICKSIAVFYRPKKVFSTAGKAIQHCREGARKENDVPMRTAQASAAG